MAEVRHLGLTDIVRHFEGLEDPRSPVNRRHPLVSVVVIALMAVLAGADGPTAIARWALVKREFLLRVLPKQYHYRCFRSLLQWRWWRLLRLEVVLWLWFAGLYNHYHRLR